MASRWSVSDAGLLLAPVENDDSSAEACAELAHGTALALEGSIPSRREAIACFERAIAAAPEDTLACGMAHLRAAQSHLQLRDVHAAAVALNSADALAHQSQDAHLQCMVARVIKDHQRALTFAQEACSAYLVTLVRGDVATELMLNQQYEAALAELDQVDTLSASIPGLSDAKRAKDALYNKHFRSNILHEMGLAQQRFERCDDAIRLGREVADGALAHELISLAKKALALLANWLTQRGRRIHGAAATAEFRAAAAERERLYELGVPKEPACPICLGDATAETPWHIRPGCKHGYCWSCFEDARNGRCGLCRT